MINDGNIYEYKINQRLAPRIDNLDSILTGVVSIGTLTTVFRKEIYNNVSNNQRTRTFLMGDLPLWLEIAHVSKIIYLPDVTASYRRLDNSASHSSNFNKRMIFMESSLQCRLYYAEIFNKEVLNKDIIKNSDISKFKVTALESNRKNTFRQFIILQKKYHFNMPIKVYVFLLVSLIPSTYKLVSFITKKRTSLLKRV